MSKQETSLTFWEKPISQLNYYEKLKRGICPECNSEKSIIIEASYEYVKRNNKEIKSYFTVIRCKKCLKSWLPTTIIKTSGGVLNNHE